MTNKPQYQVTARKWRPNEFESVVGQEHVTQTIKNAIKNDQVHHAYLFCGPRGVGKTTTARILAKALNCQNPSAECEPCNECESCRAISEGRSLDVIEIDGASNNSVDDIRKLRDNAKYAPVSGTRKLYIIDEVHMLSVAAFNALLKTLEEPPKHLVFIFATTEPHKVPATILSRCQRFDFRRMQIGDIVGRLAYIAEQENVRIDEDALTVIAKKADGSMRDSQSIFDQVRAFCGTDISYSQINNALNIIDQEFFFRVSDMMQHHDPALAFSVVQEIMRIGYDAQEFLIGLAEHLRNYLTVITTGGTQLIEAAKPHRERYAGESSVFKQGDIVRALHIVLAAQQAIRHSSQPRLRLELTLVQLAVMDSTIALTQLLEKIDRIPEKKNDEGLVSDTDITIPETKASDPTPPQPSATPYSTTSQPSQSGSSVVSAAKSSNTNRLADFPTTKPEHSPNNVHKPQAVTYTVEHAAESILVQESESGISPIAQISTQWQEFVQSCNGSLSVLLDKTSVVNTTGSIIHIGVPEQSNAQILRQQQASIVTKLCAYFGAPSVPEITLQFQEMKDEELTGSSGTGGDSTVHPFIQSIVEKLGAAPV